VRVDVRDLDGRGGRGAHPYPGDRDDPSVELVAFESEPYPRELRSTLMEIALATSARRRIWRVLGRAWR